MSAAPQRPQQKAPLEGLQLVIATIAVALATFMIVLDSSIANVAIPTIAGNLGVSTDGDLGNYRIRSCQRDIHSTHRLVNAAYRPNSSFCCRYYFVCVVFLVMRPGYQS